MIAPVVVRPCRGPETACEVGHASPRSTSVHIGRDQGRVRAAIGASAASQARIDGGEADCRSSAYDLDYRASPRRKAGWIGVRALLASVLSCDPGLTTLSTRGR